MSTSLYVYYRVNDDSRAQRLADGWDGAMFLQDVKALLEEHVVLWCDLMRTRIRPRLGVNTPPPRPPEWVFQ